MTTLQYDRERAIETARAILARPFVVFDTETTGLGDDAEIVEISCIDHCGAVLLDSLVKPTVRIPKEAHDVHGIGDRDVRRAPTFADLWPKVRALFEGTDVLAYNRYYDCRLLEQSLAAHGITASVGAVYSGSCIMELYAQYYGAWNDYRGSYTWQSLGKSVAQCSLSVDGELHRALADARMSLAVLQHIATG